MCGTVNAKNRMGGYAGRSTFFAYFSPNLFNTVQWATIDGPQKYEKTATTLCELSYGR